MFKTDFFQSVTNRIKSILSMEELLVLKIQGILLLTVKNIY